MPPLSEEDKTEVRGILTDALGLKEGQKLEDVVKETSQSLLNAYDKNNRKDRDETKQSLSTIQEALAKLSKPPEADPTKPDDDPDLSKLPPAVQKQLQDMQAANKKLADQFEASEKARKEQEQKAEESARRQADRDLRDAIRSTGTAEAIGLDPSGMDFVIAHLHGDRISRGEQSRVRLTESGRYEMQIGEDKITNEPVWKPLENGLREWSQTDIGKRFMPAVKGKGVATPTGQKPGSGGNAQTIDDLDPAAFEGKSAEQVLEMTKDVQFG